MTDADLEAAGKAAVIEGLRLWHEDIGDPAPQFLITPPANATAKQLELHARATRWRRVIDTILVSAGWDWLVPYAGNGPGPQWCGYFMARCWRIAGIDPKWLAAFFASTLRLYNWAHYRPWNDKPNPAPASGQPRRLVAKLGRESKASSLPFKPREGDIVIIGADAAHPEGRHICVATGFDEARGVITTVEGNGWGNGPDGKPREGIVVGERKIGGATGDVVLWVYRPAPSDLLKP